MKMKGIQILNFMGRSNNRLLVHKHMEKIDVNETIDIILTPQFYTFIRETLAINFAYQAKNIAPSLFDDYLNPIKEYQYHVYKCGEDWCFFAYDIEEITVFLETKGLKPYLIGKIYFAQELVHDLAQPIQLGVNDALQTIDHTVTVLPQRLLHGEEPFSKLNLKNMALQNNITLSSSHDSVIPLNQMIFMTILLTLLGASFIFEGNRLKSSISNTIENQESLISENPKLASSLIRNSELEKYQPIDQKERLKRDIVTKISKMLSQESILKELNLNEKSIVVTIEISGNMFSKQIAKSAKKENFKVISKERNQIVLEKKL